MLLNRSFFKYKRTVLAIQLMAQEVRYLIRQGDIVLASGVLPLPAGVVEDARLVSADGLKVVLAPVLKGFKGHVAVMLSSGWVHLHELDVPTGLDAEELDYQVVRHITQSLQLPITDVYYDWDVQAVRFDGVLQTVLMVVARQSDVAPYNLAFNENWKMSWACAEPLVWANAFGHSEFVGRAYAVCQVEQESLMVWHVDELRNVLYYKKTFDSQLVAQAGFVYRSADDGGAHVQLPTRFVVDEVLAALNQWIGTEGLHSLSAIYGVGRGLDWMVAKNVLQERLGLPVRTAGLENVSGIAPEDCAVVSGLWFLAEQVMR